MEAQELMGQCWEARNHLFGLLVESAPCPAEQFFTQLVDYLSLGHFEVYHGLLERIAPQNWMSLSEQVNVLLEQMTRLTQSILDQYDAYQDLKTQERAILSEAAYLLATRCDLEDTLLEQLAPAATAAVIPPKEIA